MILFLIRAIYSKGLTMKPVPALSTENGCYWYGFFRAADGLVELKGDADLLQCRE